MNKLTLIACFFALLVVAQARAPRKVVASPLPTPVPIPPYSSVLPNFLCQPPMINEEKTPDNVNKLRPHDIKAIMAMGDSITAGFAMHAEHIYDSITDLYEYRGDSYCIGGNAMQYTLGNYMTVFNPHLVGPAISVSEPISALEWKGKHLFPFNKASSRLNAAQSGAKVQDMPGQVSYLANELRTTYADQIDYDKDWKMITLLIGANNMCIACKNDTDGTASYYKQQLNLTLTQIYQTIPRTFVNVLPMFNISQVYDWVQTSSYCKDMWRTLCESECPCQTGKATNQDRYLMDVAATQYREAIWELYNEWASFNLTTFKVAVQPFTSQLAILNLDFLSGFDCFHPSWISHAAMSMGLWNSMFTPLPQKPLNISIGIDFICPTKDMYLQ